MGKIAKKLLLKGKKAAKGAYEKVETRILVAEGRKAVQGKARTVAKVSRKAAKTGLVVGALTAAGVVLREVRKRRKLDRG
jgi:hypothetical protein